MKIIKFQIMEEYEIGSGDDFQIIHKLVPYEMNYSEKHYAMACEKAYNGEVTVEEIEEPIFQQIQSLKASLSSTDYKIIKCSEAQLLGEELSYDIASLHAERQVLRDKINELEQQLEANVEGGTI